MLGERSPRRVAAWLIAGLTGLVVAVPTAQAAPSTAWIGNRFEVDVPNLVRRANIVVGSAPAQPAQLMPLGNGQMGAAVWAAGGFTAQINRTDTWPTRRSPGQVDDPRARRDDRRERLLGERRPLRRHLPPAGRRDDRDDLRPRRQGRADRRRHRRRPGHHADRAHQPPDRAATRPRERAARSRASPRRGSTPAAPAAAPARRSAASPRSPPAART